MMPAGREVGGRDVLHQVDGGGVGSSISAWSGVDDLAEVVRRDVGRHPDGDAGEPLTSRLGNRAGRTTGSES
jgi:hypothetical protein